MADFGEVIILNCKKRHTYGVILEDSGSLKRGDVMGTGDFACEDAPQDKDKNVFWNLPTIDLKIKVVKKRDEVQDPRDGSY